MKRACVALLSIFALAASAGAVSRGDAKGDFFNGKNLAGWEGLTDYWSVKDKAIVGSSPKGLTFNTFLCSKKKYKNFELKFQIRLKDGKGNSGVQIRSKVVDEKKFVVAGPQCDIGGDFWGSLYGERFGPNGKEPGGMMKAADKDLVKKTVKKDDFNDYHIKCVGKRVTIKLNGKTMVEGEFKHMHDEGIIALQLHAGGPMEAAFRNIEFRELK